MTDLTEEQKQGLSWLSTGMQLMKEHWKHIPACSCLTKTTWTAAMEKFHWLKWDLRLLCLSQLPFPIYWCVSTTIL